MYVYLLFIVLQVYNLNITNLCTLSRKIYTALHVDTQDVTACTFPIIVTACIILKHTKKIW